MTQTYRTNDPARWGTGQGFNLSPAQVDNNFWDLIQRMLAQEARPDPAAGIAYFEIMGTMMYVHMTDGTVLGPYQLPMAIFRDRGVWTAHTVYLKMDTFTVNAGLYVVVWDHTSGATFDPGANDGAGHDYYQLMIQTPGSSLPFGGTPGMLLKKASTVDYEVFWDYTDASVVSFTPATGSPLLSDNVADALEEVVAGHISSAVAVTYEPSTGSGLTSTNVQDALDELGTKSSGGSGSGSGGGGRQTLWIPATAMIARLSNGPAANTIEMTTNKIMIKTLDFDSSTQEFAQFTVAMPNSWDMGNIYFRVFWSHVTATTFGVAFGLEARGIGDANFLDNVFPTTIYANDFGGISNSIFISNESTAVTVNGTLTYPSMVQFQLCRYPADSGDTLNVDARVHGVQIYYTTTAATDD